SNPKATDNVTVSAVIKDNVGVANATLFYKYDNLDLQSANITLGKSKLRVAIECNSGTNACNIVNNDPVYSIKSLVEAAGHTGMIVDGSDIDTLGELNNYDVVVLGDSGFNDDDHSTFQSALKTWVQNGGGLVGTGWVLFSTPLGSDMDQLLPVSPSYTSVFDGTLVITNSIHDITKGVNSFGNPTYCEGPSSGVADSGAIVLGTCSSRPAIATKDFFSGKAVYLGPIYFGDFQNYGSALYSNNDARKLLLNSIEHAAGRKSVAIIPAPNITTNVTFFINATDFSGNQNNSEPLVYIADGTPPSIENITFAPSTPGVSDKINVTAIVLDNQGIKNVTIDFFNGVNRTILK
ncbi:MAG: hypothetical protein AABX82_02970, partial [Nanoarchaeota archaeon]